MLGELPFIILRELFVRFDGEIMFNFKFLNKRIFNFVVDDRVCQCVYLQKRFNLSSFKHNLKELIGILDSKKYSRFFTQEKLLYKTEGFLLYIRPYDNAMITIFKDNNSLELIINVDFSYQQILKSIEEKNSFFEDKIFNNGFIMIDPKFYNEKSILNNLNLIRKSIYIDGFYQRDIFTNGIDLIFIPKNITKNVLKLFKTSY